MHPSDIVSALKKSGSSVSAVARDCDLTQPSVSGVVQGKSRSQRVEQRISAVTGIPLYRLWPQWYDAPPGIDGTLQVGAIDAHLLTSIEQQLEATLMRLVPGLRMPFKIKARHRAQVYNTALKNGPRSTETGAGIAEVVEEFFAPYDGFEPQAIAKWALAGDVERDESIRRGSAVVVTGDNAKIAGRDNVGVQINTKGKR